MKLSKYFVDTLGIEESLDGLGPIADQFINEIVIGKLPPGHRWKFLWCGEGENTVQADDLAMLLLANQYGTEFFYGQDVYICGTYDNRKVWATWFSWGIGCPVSSAISEVFVAVKE